MPTSLHIQSLITATPAEGRALAVLLAQQSIMVIQPNDMLRKGIQLKLSNNADLLVQLSQVIAMEFQTIAAANNYWRDGG